MCAYIGQFRGEEQSVIEDFGVSRIHSGAHPCSFRLSANRHQFPRSLCPIGQDPSLILSPLIPSKLSHTPMPPLTTIMTPRYNGVRDERWMESCPDEFSRDGNYDCKKSFASFVEDPQPHHHHHQQYMSYGDTKIPNRLSILEARFTLSDIYGPENRPSCPLHGRDGGGMRSQPPVCSLPPPTQPPPPQYDFIRALNPRRRRSRSPLPYTGPERDVRRNTSPQHFSHIYDMFGGKTRSTYDHDMSPCPGYGWVEPGKGWSRCRSRSGGKRSQHRRSMTQQQPSYSSPCRLSSRGTVRRCPHQENVPSTMDFRRVVGSVGQRQRQLTETGFSRVLHEDRGGGGNQEVDSDEGAHEFLRPSYPSNEQDATHVNEKGNTLISSREEGVIDNVSRVIIPIGKQRDGWTDTTAGQQGNQNGGARLEETNRMKRVRFETSGLNRCAKVVFARARQKNLPSDNSISAD